jgi:tetratricopeptide (TPR) repeat protein
MASSTEKPATVYVRKHPRYRVPKGLVIGWRGAGRSEVSSAETISMGGIFLHTPTPLSKGSVIDLLFDLKSGEVRARAVVRFQTPGKGMGVQFMQMSPAARSRLTQLLARFSSAQPSSEENVAANAAKKAAKAEPVVPREAATRSAGSSDGQGDAIFEAELVRALEIARVGNSYEVLGVAPNAPEKQIEVAFRALARKFHPDRHMGEEKRLARMQELMGLASSAYKTLGDPEQRARYDAQLAASGTYHLGRSKTTAQETVEHCFTQANDCLRAENFVGSIVWLRKCTELAPADARYHALLARSLSTVPQYREQAVAEYVQAIQLDRWNVTPYMELGELCEAMQMPSRARELYRKILEINPLHARAHERLAQVEHAVKTS